ncbi:AfsR/SARP family transcriptional regulator [Lentzea sp.]|uniref:AfsR/SARP family transcriptional regulator n=1 Tax=Lentzea sp. TaxID=56099 RepID=UPI002C7ACB37|nr:BTAD domain-containing putative transcriptional regulator [Lentzea sp.]HUQ57772.1 BTAD domain-containing putative transcriptional regulator [Lentzea sp.]
MWPLARRPADEVAARRPGLAFTVFGMVRASRDETEIDLGSPQQRLTLSVLLLAGGRLVQVPEIIRAIWGDDAPLSARGTVRTYVYRLRKLLDDDTRPDQAVLRSDENGYQLVLATDQLDLSRFLSSVRAAEAAASAHDPRRAVTLLQAAVGELGDEPLRGVPGEWADAERRRLGQLAVRTVELLSEQQLVLGGRVDVLNQLTAVAEAEPLRERVHELLMRVLCHEGRSAEALTVYERLRVALRDELGTDPSPALRELHARVLRADPALSSKAERSSPAPVRSAPMPASLAVFAGRDAELAELNSFLSDSTASKTVVVHGTAGVGKTTFVVQWANRVASSFPDGRFFVNLRGFESEGAAREPVEVLRELLDALDPSPANTSTDMNGLIARYRSVLAERRVLLVLDNARDSKQVTPLLSAAPGCMVVITSRRELTSLVASTGAYSIRMGLLDMEESVALMTHRLGEQRVQRELPAVRAIAGACAHLPLALAVASARIASNPRLELSGIASQLVNDVEPGLDFLTTDDPHSDVRSVLSWSYRALSPEAARTFTLLALLPLSRTTTPVMASLAAISVTRARAVLRELSTLCLINEDQPNHFSWHDLLGDYAAELLAETVGADEQRAACRRLLDHYLILTRSASLQLVPTDDLPELPQITPGVTAHTVDDLQSAFSMFASEHSTLLSLFDFAAAHGVPASYWQLAWYMRYYIDEALLWKEMISINEIALARATTAGDDRGMGYAHRCLARAAAMLRNTGTAEAHLQTAIESFSRCGDRQAEGYTRVQAAKWLIHTDQVDAALEQVEQARTLFQATGSHTQKGELRDLIAYAYSKTGRYAEVVETLRGALESDYETGSMMRMFNTIDHLAVAHEGLAEYHKAAEMRELSLKLALEKTGADWANFPYYFEEQFVQDSFLLARMLYMAGEIDRALTVHREALSGFYSMLLRHHASALFQHSEETPERTAFARLERVLAQDRIDHQWFADSLRAVDDLAAALAHRGSLRLIVELRAGNLLLLDAISARAAETGAAGG